MPSIWYTMRHIIYRITIIFVFVTLHCMVLSQGYTFVMTVGTNK